MKVKVIWLQAVYFILRFCIITLVFYSQYNGNPKPERILHIQSDTEIILELILLLGLSVGMCIYILKSNQMMGTLLLMGASLFILSEASKYIEYLLGFSINHGDMPAAICTLLSLIAIFLYVSILYFICLFLKRRMKIGISSVK